MSHAEVNGLSLYYEEHGAASPGVPLVLLHGGLGSGEMFLPLLPELGKDRRVILVDLQGHGRTADIDRPLRAELMADDIAALIGRLGVEQADILGYSLGGKVALRTALQHPSLVRRLVVVSVPYRRDGWFPEVVATMDAMGPELAEPMKQSPAYASYAKNAPRPEDWPVLIGKIAEAQQEPFDWTSEIPGLTPPALLVYADADAIRPSHVVDFYALLGGGLRDPGWDGSGLRSTARLAVLPGCSHYDVLGSPALPAVALPFLDSPEE
ncbi:alpha/beta hydrolase [Streptomyces spiroverticillatus]|uniref:Alpha/beta hydrolase n=1 Tax=Streptomyces finlayi TaxID=67296 RepID=A0A918X1Y9_9ACTN|nr:alpha/beta hydrolase [Streptomyces finlayi]GHA22134.1 alpha/beta hydrolase [Streptomyces spiroverticillatus]GHD04219.1 alpha/beta hydrolase [Streptomyces finlayi]